MQYIAKFLQPSGNYFVTDCAFTFRTQNAMAYSNLKSIRSRIRRRCTLTCSAGKSYTKGNNATTTTVLSTTAGTLHDLNCFGHVIYGPQASMNQYIAKLLTHPSEHTYRPSHVHVEYEFDLVCKSFYGISTLVGYSMPNPAYTCISNMIFNHIL